MTDDAMGPFYAGARAQMQAIPVATLSAMPVRTRSEGFALRWTADERDRIKARATEAGMAVGPYLIRCALGEGDPPHLETRLDELEKRIGRIERDRGTGWS